MHMQFEVSQVYMQAKELAESAYPIYCGRLMRWIRWAASL